MVAKLELTEKEATRVRELDANGDTVYQIASTLQDSFRRLENQTTQNLGRAIDKVLGNKHRQYKQSKNYMPSLMMGGRD